MRQHGYYTYMDPTYQYWDEEVCDKGCTQSRQLMENILQIHRTTMMPHKKDKQTAQQVSIKECVTIVTVTITVSWWVTMLLAQNNRITQATQSQCKNQKNNWRVMTTGVTAIIYAARRKLARRHWATMEKHNSIRLNKIGIRIWHHVRKRITR